MKIAKRLSICGLWFFASVAGAETPVGDWPFVQKKLRREGFGRLFVAALGAAYVPRHILRTCELNVLLYLRLHDDHGPQATREGSGQVKQFVEDHEAIFARVKREYDVAPSVIAGLLYMESRFGRNLGHYNVASVFTDLAQADRPRMIEHLRAAAPKFRKKITAGIRRDIAKRAQRKAKWALAELRALQAMFEKDPGVLLRLHGSFAGAIGMPQFLPSSYLVYARAPVRPPADLGRADDAILSVGYYLHKSGWKQARRSTHEPALLKYNQSRDYARAILKLAADSTAANKRKLADDAESVDSNSPGARQ